MEVTAPGFICPLIGMGPEIIPLGLKQILGKPVVSITIIISESREEGGCRYTVGNRK